MSSLNPTPGLEPSPAALTLSDGDGDDDDDGTCPLLDMLQRFPDLFKKEVLERLDPTDRTMLEQVGRPWLAAVLASGLPRLPKGYWPRRLRLAEFCTSGERMAWAKANGCPWGETWTYAWTTWGGTRSLLPNNCCTLAAAGGHLEALQWAREQHPPCPSSEETCVAAVEGGHLEVLKWAWEHGCPCGVETCAAAAKDGRLEVLQWAREQDPACPWDERTCAGAAAGGHLEVLQWAREHGCPWNHDTCAYAAEFGHLDVLKWARENHCPWNEDTVTDGRQVRAPGGVEVGAGARVPMEREQHVYRGLEWQGRGDAELDEGGRPL